MMKNPSRWFDTVREMTATLVAIPSVSPDAEAENRCAERIREMLSVDSLSPTFWDTNDGRKNIACLLKSEDPNNMGATIVLMSHFDTVGVEDFARFGDSNLAFQPDELAKIMQATLEQKESLTSAEQSALTALHSGEWMFGRGSVDMKSGVAVNIAIMREFARTRENGKRLIDELAGNLLFLSCPDEETESTGILSAVPELLKLRDKENLNYLGVINTDYTAPRDSNQDARFVYSGTVGKLLPSFYILGARTHVGEVYRGVDASHIAAELVSRINLSLEWVDSWQGLLGGEEVAEVAPPPVTLRMRDLKSSYNVETAGEAFVYFNWLTLTLAPDHAMTKMREAARAALEAVRFRQEESFKEFSRRGGQTRSPLKWHSVVFDYASLCEQAQACWNEENAGGDFAEWLKKRIEKYAALTTDRRELSRMIVAELAKVAKLGGPAVVAFFSPPYYPSIAPRENQVTRAMNAALAQQVEAPIQKRGFYPYISDLSYVQLESSVQIESLSKNMPLFGLKNSSGELASALDEKKLEEIRALNCAVVNIGPFGSDAHGLYERVHMPYSFETVPQIIFETIHSVLKEATT